MTMEHHHNSHYHAYSNPTVVHYTMPDVPSPPPMYPPMPLAVRCRADRACTACVHVQSPPVAYTMPYATNASAPYPPGAQAPYPPAAQAPYVQGMQVPNVQPSSSLYPQVPVDESVAVDKTAERKRRWWQMK